EARTAGARTNEVARARQNLTGGNAPTPLEADGRIVRLECVDGTGKWSDGVGHLVAVALQAGQRVDAHVRVCVYKAWGDMPATSVDDQCPLRGGYVVGHLLDEAVAQE